MNRNLRQLFAAVIALFAVLGLSSTVITAIRATTLNRNLRNVRTLYHEFGSPRGSILASDGTVIAQSDPVSDAFSYQRSYTSGEIYAPVTGFFSISQRADRGLEASRSELLNGQSDTLFWQRFKAMLSGTATKGASIETSIDTTLQTLAYQLLQGKDGALVAIEPSSGRVLAMVSTPSYDPNQLASHDGSQLNRAYGDLTSRADNPMLNRSMAQLYPPGSTFKTIVAAAALQTGDYQVDTMIPAGSSYTLPGTRTALTNVVSLADGSGGQIAFEDALAYSSNTAFAQLGIALGEDAVAEQAKKLGYGSSITLDGSEATGLPMKAAASSFPPDMAQDRLALASIGQGDTQSTVLQNAMVAAAIANGGTLMQPTVVDRVRSSDLSVLSETKPAVMSQAFSADTAGKLTHMMRTVVTKGNADLDIPGVPVAAKTGTAQIGEHNESIDGWVMGFAPADHPRIAIAVVVHNTNVAGSLAAGPIMRQVMQEALRP